MRSGEEALAELDRLRPHLVVLDMRLAGALDGLDVCRQIAGRTAVIVITARDSLADRVAALETGADDFVGKPFSTRELLARVRAVLRRSTGAGDGSRARDRGPLSLGPVTLDPAAREARVDGREVELTRREFDLLRFLVERAGRVVTRDELLEGVWEERFFSPTRTIEVHVAQLRRKLGHPELIQTVRGVGYKVVG